MSTPQYIAPVGCTEVKANAFAQAVGPLLWASTTQRSVGQEIECNSSNSPERICVTG